MAARSASAATSIAATGAGFRCWTPAARTRAAGAREEVPTPAVIPLSPPGEVEDTVGIVRFAMEPPEGRALQDHRQGDD